MIAAALRDRLTAAQLDLRERPSGRPVMYQRWRSLTFLHFPCDATEIQTLLPDGLTVDTFPDESGQPQAWVGLVPFRMEGIRPRLGPTLPGLSAFPETNFRTYAHRDGQNPGVWFFSLDASQPIACELARRFFALPYHEASMTVMESGNLRQYGSTRRSDGAQCGVGAEFGDPLGLAVPGSLDFFLIERYLLYAYRNGRLYSGRVHHKPYPLRSARIDHCQETLVQAAGLLPRPFSHTLASDGVDVEVFPLQSIS